MVDPLGATLPPGRHGLPKDFVVANQRTRLISGFARSVRERGYAATTIAHVTTEASVSRRTFYEHFTGKDDIANCLLVKLLAKSIPLESGLGIYTIETLMRAEEEPADAERSMQLMEEMIARLRDLRHSTDPPPRPTLIHQPPGKRPQLSKAFLRSSQRARLVEATARVIIERRYPCVRVSDIVTEGGTARNTFYESFGSKEDAARGMIASVSEEMAGLVKKLSFDHGFGIVVVELVARFVAETREAMDRQATEITQTLGLIRSHLEDAATEAD